MTWHRRARYALAHSLRVRLMVLFVLLALAMVAVFVGGMQYALSTAAWNDRPRFIGWATLSLLLLFTALAYRRVRSLLLAISHELRSPLTRARLNTELLPETAELQASREALLRDLAQAFYRPDAARTRDDGGVGLGLYLCKLVALAHGGIFSIANANPGLVITVTLPASQSQ